MCCSALGQIVYGILMFSALALTLTGMFTPGWRKLEDAPDGAKQQIQDHQVPSGLFPIGCKGWLSGDGVTTQSSADCDNWWNDLPTWNKVVIITACLAVIAEILALVWNLLTFCACCCKQHLLHPLTALAVLTSILLAITVIVFGINQADSICDISKQSGQNWDGCESGKTNANYSFYITCAALACSLVSIGVGIIASCFANHSL
uniref:Uncharacterized protein n=1 Tax=Panagrolaimus sp. ES5 TaxID=591445 RepID=A0AC34F7E0_9BILA